MMYPGRGTGGRTAPRLPPIPCPSAQDRRVLAQGRGEVDQVLLLVLEDLPDVLGDGEFAQGLALLHPPAVLADGLALALEVEAQHLPGGLRTLDRLRRRRGRAP